MIKSVRKKYKKFLITMCRGSHVSWRMVSSWRHVTIMGPGSSRCSAPCGPIRGEYCDQLTNQRWVLRPVDQSEMSTAVNWPTRGQYHLRKLSILSTRGGLVLDFLFLCSCLFMFSPKTSPVRSAEIRSSNSVCSGPLQHPWSISTLCGTIMISVLGTKVP